MAKRGVNGDTAKIGGLEQIQLYQQTTVLTNAQIKALPSTPFTVVPAAGAGLLLIPDRTLIFFKSGASAYTNLAADCYLTMAYGTTGNEIGSYIGNSSNIDSMPHLQNFTGSTGGLVQFLSFPFQSDAGAPEEWGLVSDEMGSDANANCDLQLLLNNGGAGNLTGGASGNSWVVNVTFRIVSVP